MNAYLDPQQRLKILEELELEAQQLGSLLLSDTESMEDPDIAILSVLADDANEEFIAAARRELYRLFVHTDQKAIVDLGCIRPGRNMKDRKAALNLAMEELHEKGVHTIVLCDSPEFAFPAFESLQSSLPYINVCTVDESIAYKPVEEGTDSRAYLQAILQNEAGSLFNFSHMGHQQYLTDPKAVELIEQMNYDLVRLGELRPQLEQSEVYLRDANLAVFRLNAMDGNGFGSVERPGPNGFTPDQFCQLGRYAGLSPKLQSLLICGLKSRDDRMEVDSQLLAQFVWCYLEGEMHRLKHDQPTESASEEFLKYFIDFSEEGYQLSFWKSKQSNRWWMAFLEGESEEKPQFVSCTYDDYLRACRNELPDRWMRNYLKMS